jgi:hypothetical protein
MDLVAEVAAMQRPDDEAEASDEDDSADAVQPVTKKAKAKARARAQAQVQATDAAKPKPKTKAKASTAEPAPRPSLKFPGTSKRPPLHYGSSTVYTDRENKLWRLKEKTGDKLTPHFSWKQTSPKEMWNRLAKRIRQLNP